MKISETTLDTLSKTRSILSLSLDDLPLVSVVIPMRNEVENIQRCVESIFEQSYPP